MRIYEGTPRQDFEEVFRAIGAVLDQRGYREILLTEVPDGFLVQGLRAEGSSSGWGDSMGRVEKETLTFSDDEIARYMDEALARRGHGTPAVDRGTRAYERALRVIGRYLDEQQPRDVFFFEQEGAFVVRLLVSDQGPRHMLAEFTREDIDELVRQGPARRHASPRDALLAD